MVDSKVLLLEDEQFLREKMVDLLGLFFLNPIVSVATADEALEIFKTEDFDLVISDIKTPGTLDGLDFIAEAKKINPALKSIVITGFNQDAYTDRAKELNVNEYLVKPITIDKILDVITSLGLVGSIK